MNVYDSAEQRKRGMAMMRERMLAAHQRMLARKDLSVLERKSQESAIAIIKAAQVAKGD